MMRVTPLTLGEARRFVDDHHRHHRAPIGGLFAIAASSGEDVIGVAIVGRPVARGNQDGLTAEVTRLCVLDDQPNACSMLYAAAWRAARSMGYRRLITYTLVSEAELRAGAKSASEAAAVGTRRAVPASTSTRLSKRRSGSVRRDEG